MSNVAMNPQTGEIRVLTPDGQWQPAQRARNPQSGVELFYDGAAWRPVPPKPEPASTPARSLGLGVRDMIVGLPAIPGMFYDAAGAGINAAAAGIEAIGGPSLPRVRTAAQNLENVADAVGLPRPQNTAERRISAANRSVAGNLPAFAAGAVLQGARQAPALAEMLVGNLPSQVAGAAGAGIGGQLASEGGAGPVGQVAASLAGGVGGALAAQGVQGAGRAVAGLAQPFTEEGRRGIAADVLLRSSADPEGLLGRIAQGVNDQARRLPESPVTTGQASRDPGIMLLESGLRSHVTPGTPTGRSAAVAIRDVEARRNSARLGALSGMADGATPEARGAAIRGALDAADDAMSARVDLAFQVARDRNNNRYSVQPVMETATNATRMFSPQAGGGGVPANLQAVIDDIGRLGVVTLDQAQNIRSRLGEIAGDAAANNNARLASAARAISSSLERTVSDPRWMAAVDMRRQQGGAMGRDAVGANVTGRITRNDQFGAPIMPDATVARQATANPQSARQVLNALYKALDDGRRARLPVEQIEALRAQVVQARSALRGQFIDDLLRASSTASDVTDAAGNVSRALSPAGFRRFWEANQATAREIFEPAQLGMLRRIAADFAETGMATRTASAVGSPTAQNLSVGNLIARASNGLLDPGMPVAQTLGSLGGVLRLVYAAPEAATRELLTQAVTDPRFAQMLLVRATPSNVQRAARYIETNMAQRLMDAAIAASSRAAIRAGTAQATQPEAPAQPR